MRSPASTCHTSHSLKSTQPGPFFHEDREAIWERIREDADLYISELLMIGIDPFKVAKMAGTSLKEIDRTYGRFSNQDLAEAQHRLAQSRQGRFRS